SKSLLLEDISSILDIALALGFSNQNYFSILFRRYTGITPMQYRKNGGLEKAKSYCI
ncbi:MAG: helix-turn-helix transcriptional regulator, partial [Clostridiales bacterium]|nr:helix-turn-helix transcriptional regulator [Clostridiales bacterium]